MPCLVVEAMGERGRAPSRFRKPEQCYRWLRRNELMWRAV